MVRTRARRGPMWASVGRIRALVTRGEGMSSEKDLSGRVFRELDRRVGLTRRSPLFLWLRDNHAEMAERLADAGGPRSVNWGTVAAVLGEAGLRDADGNPPSAAVVRKTWGKVVAMVSGRSKASTPSPVAPPAPEARAAPLPPAAPKPGMSTEEQLDRVRARLRSGTVPMPVKVER